MKNSFQSENSLRYLKGVGESREKLLKSLGISTIEDLLFYFPSKYYDRSSVVPICKARLILEKNIKDEFTFIGKIISIRRVYTRRRTILEIIIEDDSAQLKAIYFQGIQIFEKIFTGKNILALSGNVSSSPSGNPVLIHPTFDFIQDLENPKFFNTGVIVPYYSLRGINQLKQKYFGSYTLREIIRNALTSHLKYVKETLPAYILKENQLVDIHTEIKNLHFPASMTELSLAKKRLKFEEMFYFQLLGAISRSKIKAENPAIKFTKVGENTRTFLQKILPFELTADQKKVLKEIFTDFKSGSSMNRLLQGEVGSGKTLVAVIASLIAFDNGFQTAIMAPTEILAFQHYQYFTKLLKEIEINICILTSSTPRKVKEKFIKQIQSGEANIIIGTHALIEERVQFHRLGFVIIDEQHRFGVMQRAKLKMKGMNPHILVMTATPIPRTLGLTLYSDMDSSVIKELPKNRKPIQTYLVDTNKREKIHRFIRKEVESGNQVYIIYPLIEESEKIDLENVLNAYTYLSENVFRDLKLGMIHGKMSADEKEITMNMFNSGKINILVSTTVIEVGIDNPNATVIVIEEAQRFGLSQLHQLRGRVGRGNKDSYCILITNKDYLHRKNENNFDIIHSEEEKRISIAYQRLNALVKYKDGFKIAEEDFKLRGPGELFGTKQSGLPEFKFVDLVEDYDLISEIRAYAFKIIDEDPNLSLEKNFILREVIDKKFQEQKFFSKIF